MLCWPSCPIRKDMVAEGLEIKLPFPGGAEWAIPVRFVENGYRTTSAAHTLVAGNLATPIKIGGVAMSSLVTWYGGDLVAKACRTYGVRPAGRCLGMSSLS